MFHHCLNSLFLLSFLFWYSTTTFFVACIDVSNQIFTQKTLYNSQIKYSNRNDNLNSEANWPIVVNTWAFVNATERAWEELVASNDRLEAVEAGCNECQVLRCDGTVGYGGSPDEHGESTLDALILDGPTFGAGAVASLKRIKNAIGVARAVMDHTKHTMLVGDAATQFAIDMGFQQEDLHAVESMNAWINWVNNSCQPNFRKNVLPDPESNCGPYQPLNMKGKRSFDKINRLESKTKDITKSHDTIGLIVIDKSGDIAAGTSTNGAGHKIPGRVGDSPIIGSGAYVDNDVGAACGTGDGDTLMKHLPAYQAVESMRRGLSPLEATQDALKRIIIREPNFSGAILAIDKLGNVGAACHGFSAFPYSYRDKNTGQPIVLKVECI